MHFRVASYLPTRECLLEDVRHDNLSFDTSFLRGAYTQPALAAEREILVDMPNVSAGEENVGNQQQEEEEIDG